MLTFGGIALAGIYLLNNLPDIACNGALYWAAVACLLVVPVCALGAHGVFKQAKAAGVHT